MERHTIALFGEAEKGEYRHPYFCHSLAQLDAYLGNPPLESQGLFYAVQALLYERNIIFFRVEEEGFSKQDYFGGIKILQTQEIIPHIAALCLPGMGDREIFQALDPICRSHRSLLITNPSDLYDYLTGMM